MGHCEGGMCVAGGGGGTIDAFFCLVIFMVKLKGMMEFSVAIKQDADNGVLYRTLT